MGMRLGRRGWLLPLVMAAGMAVAGCGAGTVNARAAGAAHGGLQLGGRPAANAVQARAAASGQRCAFVAGVVTDCASTDPRIDIHIHNTGDTSGCTFGIDVNWGDRSPLQHLTVKGQSSTGEFYLAAHTYNARGTYRISATGTVLSGWCTIGPGHYTFTLQGVPGKLRWAVLGDSYSSGEGVGVYDPASHGCHRSPYAWSYWAARNDRWRLALGQNVACSGATSQALTASFKDELPQLTALSLMKPAPTLVTMTMGGNDVGFSKVLLDCYFHRCLSDGELHNAQTRIAFERAHLVSDYKALRQREPAAAIVIVGYPRLFAATGSCGRFTPEMVADMNRLADQLNHVIKQSAADIGVRYVDVTTALKGHEMCTKDPWIIGVGVKASLQEEGHPNARGQLAIADIVRRYIEQEL